MGKGSNRGAGIESPEVVQKRWGQRNGPALTKPESALEVLFRAKC